MSAVQPLSARGAPTARPGRRFSFAWLGVVPFVAFALMFLIIPTFYLATNSFRNLVGSPTTNPAYGALTFDNYAHLTIGQYPEAYRASLEISLVTALVGGIFGFLLAYAVIAGGLPRFLRSALMTFSGVAANFAGIPLGLAFFFTLGTSGILTPLLTGFGLHVTPFSKTGVELAYIYFQFPLMVLMIAPAIDGLRKDWREAAENMGATTLQYWRDVALPILMPSLLGSMLLLFGNAFGAQATAYALNATLNIVTIQITRQLVGDVANDEGVGYALAMGMILIMALAILAYAWLQRRSERWLR